jgi:hypothetical protein
MNTNHLNKVTDEKSVLVYAVKDNVYFITPFIIHRGIFLVQKPEDESLIAYREIKESNYEKINLTDKHKRVIIKIISEFFTYSKTIKL